MIKLTYQDISLLLLVARPQLAVPAYPRGYTYRQLAESTDDEFPDGMPGALSAMLPDSGAGNKAWQLVAAKPAL